MKHLPIVIYTYGGGRLGNQLIRFAHWLAWAIEHAGNVQVVDAGFWPYARYFECWNAARGCGFPRSPVWAGMFSRGLTMLPGPISHRVELRLLRAIQAAGEWLPAGQRFGSEKHLAQIDLAGSVFLDGVAKTRVTTCAGWRIGSWALFAKHESAIRELLAPSAELALRTSAAVEAARYETHMIVGVAIRQGDYRVWCGGKFFFETTRYVKAMHEFVELHAGRRIRFLVTSDEWQDPAAFAGLDVVWATGSMNRLGRAVDSMFELARCDAILAPPSTFAAWASHWGRVPWWPIGESREGAQTWCPVAGDLNAARQHAFLSAAIA